MKQILINLVKQKTKINKDIEEKYYKIEKNEEVIFETVKEIRTIRRPTRNRKNKNQKYDDLSLRITVLKYL